MEIYREYEIIDEHVKLSSMLHLLNIEGKQLIREIETRKHIRQKRSGNYVFSPEVQTILNSIIDVTNTKRFNKLRLYFCIQYYLDELLFKSVRNLDSFHIEDDCYKLTDLYFNQSTWNNMTIDDLCKRTISVEKFLTYDDALVIQAYFRKYIEFLENVNESLATKKDIEYIKRQWRKIMNKVKGKFTSSNVHIQTAIEEHIN